VERLTAAVRLQSMTTPVKRPSGRDEVVEALLDTAQRLFARTGPGEVSLREIARAAGVNHGLVHRHFGTRDDLVDRLMERMAATWTQELVATGDYLAAIDSILGSDDEAPTTAGAWLRLLAWSLLTESPERSGAVQRRYATLDRLPPLLAGTDPDDATIATAAALSLVFGWRFFHPYIRAALHLDDVDFTELQDAMRSQLHRLVDDATGAATAGARTDR
jgi:TetR/AcrR family transcriptional regulator, repressor for neighboring sulfatase